MSRLPPKERAVAGEPAAIEFRFATQRSAEALEVHARDRGARAFAYTLLAAAEREDRAESNRDVTQWSHRLPTSRNSLDVEPA